jgi:integrase
MALKFSKLDKDGVRKLKADERIMEHGIIAMRLPDGDLRWKVNVMVDGQRINRVLGRESEGVSRSTCEEFIEAKRTEAREGRLNLPAGRKTHMGFKDAGEKYIKVMEETGGKNLGRKRQQLEQHLTPYFGDQRLNTISEFTIAKYAKHRQDQGAATGTIRNELATLSHLFTIAASKAHKWVNGRFRIARPKATGGRIIALNDEQSKALMDAAVGDIESRLYLFVAFGLNTAMRHSEILAARFDRVDWDKLRLHVPEAKAGMREQPITPELREVLLREREMADDPDGWIFPAVRKDTNSDGHRRRLDRAFRRAVEAAGMDPTQVTPHVMRHTAITNLVKAGVDIPTIQKISAHKTVAMVLRYTHVHDEHIDTAIRSIGRAVPQRTTAALRVVK